MIAAGVARPLAHVAGADEPGGGRDGCERHHDRNEDPRDAIG
jgi:hypothetical protein